MPSLLLAVLLLFAHGASAQLLQADVVLPMPPRSHGVVKTSALVEPGPATVLVKARNLREDAVVVDLGFRYRLPRDFIGLDELIERIEVTTETASGEPFFAAAVDAQLIPLNPNRVPLLYRVTLYRPPQEPYAVRVRVYGNYE
ncbi:MAG: hypothetical protein DCC71_05735 [Proteobacteria bacterium]|nr:MAG: hypothetical protein DCC71_05735 [Pseudomonadota bacterium]